MDVDEEQNVVRNWAPYRPDGLGEEIGCPQRLDVSTNEVVPGPVTALRSRVKPVFFQDAGDV